MSSPPATENNIEKSNSIAYHYPKMADTAHDASATLIAQDSASPSPLF